MTGIQKANQVPEPISLRFGRNLDRWSRTIAYILAFAIITVPRLLILISINFELSKLPQYVIIQLIAYLPIVAVISFIMFKRGRTSWSYIILTLFIQLDLIFLSVVTEGVGPSVALIVILITVFITFFENRGVASDYPIVGGIIASVVSSILNIYSPLEQLVVASMAIFLLVYFFILALTYLLFVFSQIIPAPIRIKLLMMSLAVSLTPIILISAFQLRATRLNLQEQNFSGLQLAATQTTKNLDDFIKAAQYNASLISSFDILKDYLANQPNFPANSIIERELITTIDSATKVEQAIYLHSIAVLGKNGVAVYDTKAGLRIIDEADQDHFRIPLDTGRPYVSPLLFSPDSRTPYLVISSPILDRNRNIIGVLRIKYLGTVLQKILDDNKSLFGTRSYPLLISEDGIRIADAISPLYMYSPAIPLTQTEIDSLLEEGRISQQYISNVAIPGLTRYLTGDSLQTTGEVDVLEMNPGLPEAVAVGNMTTRPWHLVYVQDQGELLGVIAEQRRGFIHLTTLIAGVAALISLAGARVFSNPIARLTNAADKISSGNLAEKVTVQTNDELTTLANSFNIMTGQLTGFIEELEDRVQARTEELAAQNELLSFRANQLRTIADVGQGITATADLNLLLTKITQLVSDRFEFYHVGIFLLDEQKEYAVLRASNSTGGQRMLGRNHKLQVGQVGIVGYVTAQGKPRIALDVGQDAVFFNNPDLPETRSEMALPLKAGDDVIGALDVQSTTSNAFSENDIELFSILADQIAIAILNSRLYEETNRALNEMQALHRQYLRQEWSAESAERQVGGYRYSASGLVPLSGQTDSNPDVVYEFGKPVATKGTVTESGSLLPDRLSVPILLRGEVIGAITIEEPPGSHRGWSDEDVRTISTLSDQLASTLEISRLFEQTNRRAERERKVYEITSKIRSATSAQSMLELAVNELKTALNVESAQIVINKPLTSSTPVISSSSNNGHE